MAKDYQSLYVDLRRRYEDAVPRFERNVALAYELFSRPGFSMIDCGAGTGTHTFQMAKLAEWVHAYEPLRSRRDVITQQAADQGIKNIVIHSCALSSFPLDEAPFWWVKEAPGKSGLNVRLDLEPDLTRIRRTVPVSSLDEYPFEGQVAFIKIDVEGGEYDILEGGRTLIEHDRPAIHFEAAVGAFKPYGVEPYMFWQFFSRRRYALFDIVGNPLTTEEEAVASIMTNGVYDYLAVPREHPKLAVVPSVLSFEAQDAN